MRSKLAEGVSQIHRQVELGDHCTRLGTSGEPKLLSCAEGWQKFWKAEVTKFRCFDVAERVLKYSGEPKSRSSDVSMLRRG